MIQKHNQESLERLINEHEEVVVRFTAEWCGPCKSFAPIFNEVALESANEKTVFVVIDVDKNPELTNSYGIRGLPSVLFFLNGVRGGHVTGVMTADQFRKHINQQFNR